MLVLFKKERETLTAYLSGDIDHHSTKTIRQEIDLEISKQMPRELILDFSHVNFMDSSGVGLVMGRYKLCLMYCCKVVLTAMPKNVYKIMNLSGLVGLVEFR